MLNFGGGFYILRGFSSRSLLSGSLGTPSYLITPAAAAARRVQRQSVATKESHDASPGRRGILLSNA